jgi:hypothetical protein
MTLTILTSIGILHTAKIRNLKALGKKSSELSEDECPCNFAEARKIFARVVNYKATFEVLMK